MRFRRVRRRPSAAAHAAAAKSHELSALRLVRPGTLQSQPLPSVALPLAPLTDRHTPAEPDVSQALPVAQSLEVWHSVAQVPSLAQR
jgi:hypothetical protein